MQVRLPQKNNKGVSVIYVFIFTNKLHLPRDCRCAYHNNHYDGFMNFMSRDEEVNYFPSRCVWRTQMLRGNRTLR